MTDSKDKEIDTLKARIEIIRRDRENVVIVALIAVFGFLYLGIMIGMNL